MKNLVRSLKAAHVPVDGVGVQAHEVVGEVPPAPAIARNLAELAALVQKDADAFRADQNLGLVQQVVERAPRWLIKRLTLTYITLGLADIGREVGIDAEEARAVVMSMVSTRPHSC